MTPGTYIWGAVAVGYAPDIPTAQASSQASGALYLSISYTDPIEGALTFLIGKMGFDTNDGRVYPAIEDWGSIRNYLGGGSPAEVTLSLVASAVLVSTSGTTRYTIDQLFRSTVIRGQPVTIYQHNFDADDAESVWKGYLVSLADYTFDGGIARFRVVLRSETTPQIVALSPTVNQTDDPNAPTGSIGQMKPVGYGDYHAKLSPAGSGQALSPVALGAPMPGVAAVAVDEKIGSGSSRWTRYCISRADGTAALKSFQLGSLATAYGSQSTGDVVLYLPEISSYAILDPAYGGGSTTATEAYADINNAARVHAFVRPVEIGSANTPTDAYKAIDSDTTNSVTLSGSGQYLSYAIPNVNIGNGRIEALYVALDIDHPALNPYEVGLWNPNDSGGADYWGGSTRYAVPQIWLTTSLRTQFTTQNTTLGTLSYTQADAAYDSARSTSSQFQQGRFVALDASGNEKPIELRIKWLAGTVNVYGVALIVQLIYPKKSLGKKSVPYPFPGISPAEVNKQDLFNWIESKKEQFADPESLGGLQVFSKAQYQADDGSGTYTGTASALISKAPDIVRHILQKRGGFGVNSTAGTLGNFTDMRTEDVTGDKALAPNFSSQPVDALTAAYQIISRWPMRIARDQDTYNAFGDDMNPHSSRIYRSASEPVRISAKRDMVGMYMRVYEDDPTQIVNRATVNYGIGYGRGDSLGSYRYDNPMSQEAFGVSVGPYAPTIDEPWIVPSDVSAGAPQNAKFLAQWYGRRSARPRLNVVVRLTQAFYDLKRGHVLEFDTDLEEVGLQCPAFRCGLFDFASSSTAAATNQAFDSTPEFVPASGTSVSTWMAQQQTDHIDLYIASAGTYTNVTNAWGYHDGTSRVAFSGVTCSDGGSADEVFKRTGHIRVSWTRPTITSWKKSELTFDSALKGPGYPIQFAYTSATGAATGNAVSAYDAKWYGRLFEVLDTSRDDSTGIPVIEVVLRELM